MQKEAKYNAAPQQSGVAIEMAARSWIGTSFVHQGRKKRSLGQKGGVDCLGLLIGVASELCLVSQEGGELAQYDALDYSKSPDGEFLYRSLCQHLQPLSAGCSLQSGDVLLFSWDGNPQHLAIVSDYASSQKRGSLGIIHAYAPLGKVVEHRLEATWLKRKAAAFRFEEKAATEIISNS